MATTVSTNAGEIKSPLDKIIAESGPNEKIGAIALLADRVDNEALNQRLKDTKATFEQRHYEVITSLQQKATLTQGPVLRILHELEAQGEVDDIQNFWIANIVAFEGTAEAIKKIAALDAIDVIEFDMPVESIKPIISDSEPPLISTHSQGLDVINAPQAWAMGYTGAGRLVANIDTGVDGGHAALSPRWRGNNGHPSSECWYDPVGSTTYPTDYGSHGTHTMGTICGRTNSGSDTVGVAIDAQWIACATIDNGATTQQMIASFQFCADPDNNPFTTDDVPDAVGNSWGWSPFFHGVPHCDNTFWTAMDGCENAGCAVIFAAGNEGDYGGSNVANSLRTPADRATTYYNAFAVGAIDGHTSGYPIADFSSRGPCDCASGDMNIKPELVAPGVDVYSSVPGGGYQGGWNGTSMACPHITGAVAVLRQVNPNLSVDQVKDIMLQSCVDLGTTGEDNWYGHGYLDLYQAVQLAMTDRGYVEGYVRDATYNSPLPATINVIGESISTTANSSGYYFLTLEPDLTYQLQATYTGYGSQSGYVTIHLDDTTSQNFYLDPPIIGYSPVSYNVSVPPGETTNRDLTISNTGVGTIFYSLSTETYSGLVLDNGQEIPIKISSAPLEPLGYKMTDTDKPGAVEEPYYPPVILNEGGPDAYGHTWIDSDESGGPSVSWVDISSYGTSVDPGEDGYSGPISVGFSFPFYDNNYSTLYICSNGILTFGSGSGEYTNTNIPNSSAPNNFIAPFWDDFSPQYGGPVLYYYDSANSRFIVSFIDVPFYDWSGGTGSATFQAILYSSGQIDFNYQTLNAGGHNLSENTIGIEAVSASDGLQIVYNASYIHSNMSIRISAGSWLSVNPENGSVPASGTDEVTVTFDASELAEGIYTGNINLENNSPNNPHIDIPVTLNVSETPVPLIELNVSAIYDTVYSGYSSAFELLISNSGDANLTYNVSDNRTWIGESPSGGTVTPSGTDPVDITFDASSLAPGSYSGSVTITSNDPNNPTIILPVYLFVDLLLTDDVGVTEILNPPDSMATGVGYPLRVEITNFGSDSQTFDAVFEIYYTGEPTPLMADTVAIVNMPDNSTSTYTFAEQFTPTLNAGYDLIAYTTLATDQVPANNSSSATSHSFDIVSIWYGDLDGSPVPAPLEDDFLVDVYVQTPQSAYIADMHVCLGADDLYIDSMISETDPILYYPLTDWQMAEFFAQQGSPPNPAGWSSQSFMGFARLAMITDTPWLHSESPLKVMSFIIRANDDDDLIGETHPAIGPGLNLYQGPSNAGDTVGGLGYQLSEQFSELQFIPSLLNTVTVWYGRTDDEPVEARVNGNVYIDAFVQTPVTGYVGDMHLCLGANDQYIDSMISETESIVYYPLSEWNVAEFLSPYSSPPNPAGWSSQSFVGFSRIANSRDDAPWLHSETPLRVMRFIVQTPDNPGLIGQTLPAIGPGLSPYQGPSNAGDTSGDFSYYVYEYHSLLSFVEAPSGCDYVPGDANGDEQVIGSDVTFLVNYFGMGGAPPPDSCYNESAADWLYSAADANGDCQLIGSDVTFLVNYFRQVQPAILWCPETPPIMLPLGDDPGEWSIMPTE
ncbi:MAG: S8 family serine peptidase [candidate division Zixibacteria bacterium]|nr:S8 family serine peptidase [candidate division Zixibacteria bacterium]